MSKLIESVNVREPLVSGQLADTCMWVIFVPGTWVKDCVQVTVLPPMIVNDPEFESLSGKEVRAELRTSEIID